MERTTPLTKEELALEILKLSAVPIEKNSSYNLKSEIEANAKATAKAYTQILDILYNYEPKIED